jgi:REP element-mobilizing transposase RayT
MATEFMSSAKLNTYSQMYDQIVFAVQGRENIIPQKNKEELQKYITGILKNRVQKLLAVNCMPDHTHIFIEFKPNICISDLVRDIKPQHHCLLKKNDGLKVCFIGKMVSVLLPIPTRN